MFFRAIAIVIGAAGLAFGGDLGRAMEQFKARDYAGSEQSARAVADAEPGNAEALRILGLSLVYQDKSGEALPVLERAEKADSKAAGVKLALAAALAGEKRYDEADRKISEAESIQPDNPELSYYKGMMLVLHKQYKEAVPLLEEAIDKDPENAYAYYYAGLAHSNTRRPDKMVGAFNNFLRLAPNAPEAAKVRSFLRAVR